MAEFKGFVIPESVQAELNAREHEESEMYHHDLLRGLFKTTYEWDNDEQRGVPNTFLRSALFGVVRRGRRGLLEDTEIAAWGSDYIKYTGATLMQSDQDAWMACVQACKRSGKTQVVISQSELLRLAGKSNNKAWLMKTLKRLVATAITVKAGRYTYIGSLIHDAVKDDETGHIALNINHKMLELFGAGTTHLEFQQRQALASDLSKWLHCYALSHASSYRKPHLIGLDKLQVLCGSQSDIRNFRRLIKRSMGELKAQKIVAGWTLENDILKLWK